MKTKTMQILTLMRVLSWVAFLGLMIKIGAILISYCVSIGNPQGAKNLYMGMDLFNLRMFNFWYYSTTVSLLIAIMVAEAYTAYLVIGVLSRIKLENPFKPEVAQRIEKISYLMLGTWAMAMMYNGQLRWLLKKMGNLQLDMISGDFIFLAGVVFVIAQIFKRGVEIQSENELTI